VSPYSAAGTRDFIDVPLPWMCGGQLLKHSPLHSGLSGENLVAQCKIV